MADLLLQFQKVRNDFIQLLVVEDAIDDDNSIVKLSSQAMDKLEIFCGDAVKLTGKKRRKTICTVFADDTCPNGHIRMYHGTQNNLRVHSGDIITIEKCPGAKYGKHIHVLPIHDTMKVMEGDLLQNYLKPYFHDAYRPVYIGDTFTAHMKTHTIEFKVIETEPSPYCIVAPETVIHCEGEPIEREVKEEIYFDDIGGLEDVKKLLKELIQGTIEHQEVYHKYGMALSHGVLLFGPAGCGKTMLAKALANECKMNFISINCQDLLSIPLNNIEDYIRNMFDKARQIAPCILLIDQFDYLFNCPRNNDRTLENISADRLVNQILTEIDGINVRTKVFIIATTDRPRTIATTFFRPGRLDELIYVQLPDQKSREAILKIALQKWSVAKDVDLTYLAIVFCGLTSADIIQICRKACVLAVRELIEKEKSNLTLNLTNEIRRDHFENVFKPFPRCCSSDNHHTQECKIFAQQWQSPYSFASSLFIPDAVEDIDDDDLYG